MKEEEKVIRKRIKDKNTRGDFCRVLFHLS